MLTLDFKDKTDEEQPYYVDKIRLSKLGFKFATEDTELPYIMTANPSIHRRGVLRYSDNNMYAGRSVNVAVIKQMLESSPILNLVTMSYVYYFVGKGFFAKVLDPRNIGKSDLKILFAVTANVNKPPTSPHDLKIYIDRELYETPMKRIMSVLKPYMANHKGDILVTTSINAHLAYKFELPVFTNLRQRAEFADLMKELFYRSIYWGQWNQVEQARLQEQDYLEDQREAKIKRERDIQERMLKALSARDIPEVPVIEAVQLDFPQGVTEVLESVRVMREEIMENLGIGEERMQILERMEDPMLPPQEEEGEPLGRVEVQPRRSGRRERLRESLERLQQMATRQQDTEDMQEQLDPLGSRMGSTSQELTPTIQEGQLTPPPLHTTTTLQRESTEPLIPQDQFEITFHHDPSTRLINLDIDGRTPINPPMPVLETPPEADPIPQPPELLDPSIIPMTDDEMTRVMARFAMTPDAPDDVVYSDILHPITGQSINSGIMEAAIAAVNAVTSDEPPEIHLDENGEEYSGQDVGEDDEIVLLTPMDEETEIDNEDYLNEVRDRNEEELDNDPANYTEAEIVEAISNAVINEVGPERIAEAIRQNHLHR